MPLSAAILAAAGEGGMAVAGAAAAGAGAGPARGPVSQPAAGARAARRARRLRRRRADLTQQRAGLNRLAFLGDDLREHAGGGRVDFERHLVGLEFGQRLVGAHDVARLLEPAADRRLGDGFAERRDANFSHALSSLAAPAPSPCGKGLG